MKVWKLYSCGKKPLKSYRLPVLDRDARISHRHGNRKITDMTIKAR